MKILRGGNLPGFFFWKEGFGLPPFFISKRILLLRTKPPGKASCGNPPIHPFGIFSPESREDEQILQDGKFSDARNPGQFPHSRLCHGRWPRAEAPASCQSGREWKTVSFLKKKQAKFWKMSKKNEKSQAEKQEQQNRKEKGETAIKAEDSSPEAEGKAANETDKQEDQGQANNNGEDRNELEARIAEMNDKYLRLYSDFDNYRKRANKEKLEMIKTASADVVLALLPVIDDMERAIKAFQDTEAVSGEEAAENQMEKDLKVKGGQKNALFEGVNLIYSKMIGILKQKGVKECEVMGKVFDPETAEAIAQIPAPDESKKGLVLDVVQKGYAIEDKVIRFAKVVVGC